MADVKVEGLSEILTTLRRTLPDHLHNKALDAALAQGAKLIVGEAKSLAPRDTGVLRRAIHQMRSRFSTRTRPARIIRVRSGKKQQKKNRDAFYWRFVEFGHAVIRKSGRGSLGTPEAGFFGAEVQAQPPRPFMRPAFERRKNDALQTFRKSVDGEIQKVARRAYQSSLNRLRRSLLR